MKIQVQLFATLSGYLPGVMQDHGATLDVPDGSTIREVVERLGIPADTPMIALVNGRDALADGVLKEGDTVAMFPPLAGGCAARGRRRTWPRDRLDRTEDLSCR